jgi:hypothetical protein
MNAPDAQNTAPLRQLHKIALNRAGPASRSTRSVARSLRQRRCTALRAAGRACACAARLLLACKDPRRFKHHDPGSGVIAQIALYAPTAARRTHDVELRASDVGLRLQGVVKAVIWRHRVHVALSTEHRGDGTHCKSHAAPLSHLSSRRHALSPRRRFDWQQDSD